MRPANIVTSIADVWAGIAIAGYFNNSFFTLHQWGPVLLITLSTIGLYAGGIVFNDVFDAELDAVERPERPIPSGLIPKTEAITLGIFWLTIGVLSAMVLNFTSGLLAVSIGLCALVYNKWGKHQVFVGPINMGLCRGLNLLLGISIIPFAVGQWWFLAFVPIIYIAAITMISRGEVYGGRKQTLYFAAFLYFVVIVSISLFAFSNKNGLWAMAFVIVFGLMINTPLQRAMANPIGPNIGKAVKAGVLALIVMDAAWASAFGAWYAGLAIILLLPLSVWLGRKFAVT